MDAPGRLHARPGTVTEPGVPGLRKLHVEGRRDTCVFVPPDAARPAPLVLLLHGAGCDGPDGLRLLLDLAEAAGMILVAPASQAPTWDIIAARRYGPDRDQVDRTLDHVFTHCAVDPARVGIGGFSDGASYALSLGLANGDLFWLILAFSPGFAATGTRQGRPRIFMSHGTDDHILPIDRCSRIIARDLRAGGYDLTYREFDGEHVIPPAVAAEAVAWFRA